MKPILSVIIVTYNHETTISKCIFSLVQHLLSLPIEIVIIDNHSNDNTVPQIETQISQTKTDALSFFLVKNRLNLGYTKAMNQGLKQASGRFILFLNPDLIHCNYYLTFNFSLFLLLNKIPAVLTIHDPFPHTGDKNIKDSKTTKNVTQGKFWCNPY